MMRHAWGLVTGEPADASRCLAAAAALDPELGVAEIWDGGALLIMRPETGAQLVVLRSERVERWSALDRIRPGMRGEGKWWTEVLGHGWAPSELELFARVLADVCEGSVTSLA